MSLKERHSLEYEILSDTNNEAARQFGLVYKLDDKLLETYKALGIDLEVSQGNTNSELPFAATYVVNTDGVIIGLAVDYDYTKD